MVPTDWMASMGRWVRKNGSGRCSPVKLLFGLFFLCMAHLPQNTYVLAIFMPSSCLQASQELQVPPVCIVSVPSLIMCVNLLLEQQARSGAEDMQGEWLAKRDF